jgi:hypothetical protein
MSSDSLQIGLRENRDAFSPGDEITGAVRWELPEAPESAEVRLCWFTRGKGTEDSEIVESVPLDAPQAGDVRTFSFRAPPSPYSFSGRLISLIWCVELVIEPQEHFKRAEITIAPDGKEVVLPHSAGAS